MKKSILCSVSILVILTLVIGGILVSGVESGFLEAIATPFLYPGCMIGWMIKGDNFASSQEFLSFGFRLSIPINAVLGVLLGVIVGLIMTRFGRLRAIRSTVTPPGPQEDAAGA